MTVDDTTTQEDTNVSTDTSTNEDTSSTDSDVDLESDDVFDDIVDDIAEADPKEDTEESATPEKSEEVEESEEDEEESEKSEDTEQTTDKELNPEEERKRLNDEAAKARIEAKEARKEADAVKKASEEANIQRYLREAEDDETELQRRQLDVGNYRLKEREIGLNGERLETELRRAVADIDLFKTGTEAVKNRMLRAVEQFEATSIVKDDKGRPLTINGDLYQYLNEEANSIRELLGDGARAQNEAKSKQKSRTMATPSKSPKKEKVDPDLAAFDDYVKRGWQS